MYNLLFGLYMLLGIVKPQDKVDGRTIYTIHSKSTHIEYAYKGEVIQWIRSHQFEYNEDIVD
jgi:hypothetical protein